MNALKYTDKKILIVDDQRSFQVMLKAMLANFGATKVQFAHSGEQAIAACKKHPFDILLVDYNLGAGKNGRQLLEELKTLKLLGSQTLFIMISGDHTRSMILGALEMEPDDFITKPFSQYQLNVRLQKTAAKKSALSDIYEALNENDHSLCIELCLEKMEQNSRYQNLLNKILAHSYIHLHQLDEARILLEEIMDNSQQTWVKVLLGQVYYLQSDYDKAIDLLDRTIVENPLILKAYDWLARSLLKKEDPDTAVEVIKHATDISSQSIERQELQAELAMAARNYELVKESYYHILQLSRKSIHSGPEHLCNYIRSIIEYADHEEDPYKKGRLLQEVNSALFRGRLEEARNEEFNYEAFEGLNQAKVLACKGEYLKAKRTLFKTNEFYLNHPKEAQDLLLADTFLALNKIGEFEYAHPFSKEIERRFEPDSKIRKILNQSGNTSDINDKKQKFEQLNRQGIRAYEAHDYQNALEYFTKALKVAPVNTGAAINKIQVSLELLSNHKLSDPSVIEECRRTFSVLNGIALAKAHQNRLAQLKNRFTELTGITVKL